MLLLLPLSFSSVRHFLGRGRGVEGSEKYVAGVFKLLDYAELGSWRTKVNRGRRFGFSVCRGLLRRVWRAMGDG